jgi:hypothetical protein
LRDDVIDSASSGAYELEASKRCIALLKSLRLTKKLQGVIDEAHVPLPPIDPLPAYAPTDRRSSDSHIMEELYLALRVVIGVMDALAQLESPKTKPSRIAQYLAARAEALKKMAQRQGLPRVAMSAWKGPEEILVDLGTFLHHSIYDSESDLSREAAWYAAERHAGVIFFLAIFPNIPLIVPTLEIRLLFTKPLVNISRGMKAVFGNFFVLGFFVSLVNRMAELFDAIPRLQVRVVQRIVIARWLRNERRRASLVDRYLRAAMTRVAKPRADAIRRGLLAIVS